MVIRRTPSSGLGRRRVDQADRTPRRAPDPFLGRRYPEEPPRESRRLGTGRCSGAVDTDTATDWQGTRSRRAIGTRRPACSAFCDGPISRASNRPRRWKMLSRVDAPNVWSMTDDGLSSILFFFFDRPILGGFWGIARPAQALFLGRQPCRAKATSVKAPCRCCLDPLRPFPWP